MMTVFKNDDQKKIIFMTHYTDMYGANKSLLDLISGLKDLGGFDVVLIAPNNGPVIQQAKKLGITCKVIPFTNEIYFKGRTKIRALVVGFVKYITNWYLVYKNKSLFQGNNAIIHSNTSVFFWGAYCAKKYKLPHIWHIREFAWEDYGIKYSFGYQFFNNWLKQSNAIIAISEAIYNKRVASVQVPIRKIVYNGILDTSSENGNRHRFINKQSDYNTFTISIIGFISPEKNQITAIEAFEKLHKKYPYARLNIIGKGVVSYESKLKSIVVGKSLQDKINFLGHIDNIDEVYANSDLLLMCSKNEALGRVTIEAMSKGVPVIGYNNAGTSEIIQDNMNGKLYNGGAEELSHAIAMLIDNADLRKRLASEAMDFVYENFTKEQYVDNIASIYHRLQNN